MLCIVKIPRIMVWVSRFCILLSLISVFFVLANYDQYAEIHEKKTDAVKTEDLINNKTESTSSSEAPREVANKVLVEVTDAIEEEEEEGDALVYTPSIAPATPQILIASQSVQHTDAELLKSKKLDNDNDNKTDGTNKSKVNPEPDELIASEVLIEVVDGIDEGGHMVYTSISAQSHVDPTFSISSISQSVKTDHGLYSTELEDTVTGSNLDQKGENLLPGITGNKNSDSTNADELHSEVDSNGIKKLKLSSTKTEKDNEDESVIKVPDGNVHAGSIEKNTHVDSSPQFEILGSVSGIDGVHSINDRKKDNEPTLQDQQPKDERDIISNNDSSTNSEDKTSITLTNNVSVNETINKETEKDLVENVAKSADDEKSLEKEVSDQSQQQHQPQPGTTDDNVGIEDGEDTASKDEKKMLSFAEWKKRLDKEKVEEDIVVDSKSPLPRNKTTFKGKKIRKNFASIDCGGKVISANEEASNILSVLKEDKDEYMLNPCNVKAWFVVELCDRIQIDSIDLANFEMFSSTPETFNVYVTSRYPSGVWEKVGSFHAKPEKEIQAFLFEEKFYGRYIKIEIKKYFGNEHYCPLSLLRVFGITEVEQFEDNDEPENSPEELNPDDTEHVTADHSLDANAANLFEAAKNVVADLVNGMAKKLAGTSNSETNESGISKQGAVQSSVVVTVPALSKESVMDEKDTTFYYKDSMIVGKRYVDWEMWYYYRYPKRTCSIANLIKRLKIKKIKATVYFNHSTTTNVQTLSSTDKYNNMTPSKSIPITPHLSAISKTISQNHVNISLLKSEVTPSEVQKATQAIEKTNMAEASLATPSLDVIPVETPTVKLNESAITSTTTGTSKNIASINLINVSIIPPTQSSVAKPIVEESVDILEFKVNNTLKGAVIAEKMITNDSIALYNGTDRNTTVVSSDEKRVDEAENITNLNLNDSNVDLQDNVTNIKENNAENIDAQDPSTSQGSMEIEKSETSALPVSSDIVGVITTTVEITSNSHVKSSDKTSENVVEHSIEKDTQTAAAKTTSGSKESIIAKLNAKVKALQVNLTMSMMYLDEMSERYRTAVEEVDERHKKKNLALNSTIQHHQSVIKHQTNLIANLTDQINTITLQIQNLTRTTQEQHQKIIETHATWVFLEITIILIFLLLCRGKPRAYGNVMDDGVDLHRRSSEPAVVRSTDSWTIEKPLKKQLSDPGITSDTYCNNQLQNVAFVKKRKRKKNIKSNVSEIETNKTSVSSTPGTTEKAGLLFGRGLFNGIAGAFTRRKESTEKLSRRADALLDNVSDTTCCDVIPLRKVKSSELATIDEDDDVTIIERPKSCTSLDGSGFRKCNKNTHRAAGRFG